MATDGDIKMEYPHVQKKPTNTNEDKIQIDPTPPTTPPNHQPRTSQDFKMRILTKKKVNLPKPTDDNNAIKVDMYDKKDKMNQIQLFFLEKT